MHSIRKLFHTILSISGFIPEHMTVARAVIMIPSVLASIFILPHFHSIELAIIYFAVSTIVYIGFICLILPKQGLRLRLIERFGEEKAYLYYEAFLAFAFFQNGVALSFISQCSAGSGFRDAFPRAIVIILLLLLFAAGLVTKIWAAYVVGIPIYYWKDMFLGRKVSEFVETGPYKYLSNPMYGIGQLQVYAIAIYYDSVYGIIFGAINQALVFLFYFTVEKPFIIRTYISPQNPAENFRQ
jgi:protein-S-isoprenylcysteine O-methyltransferase Ste14